MPKTTIVEMPPPEQAQLLAVLRQARHGEVLAAHILLLCAAQRTPTAIAASLFCSRSSVYRVVRAYRAGQLTGLVAAAESGPAAPSPAGCSPPRSYARCWRS